MSYYKIKNVTNQLQKRDPNKNKILAIEYSVGFDKKTCSLPVGGVVYLSCGNLPISIHKLRIKKYVEVHEISSEQFLKLQKTTPSIMDKNVIIKPLQEVVINKEEETTEKTETKKPKRGTPKYQPY